MLSVENKTRTLGIIVVILLFLATSIYFTLCSSSTKSPPPSTAPSSSQPAADATPAELPPTETTLTGIVKDVSGNPIEHAFVSQGWSPFTSEREFRHTYTDTDGSFILDRAKVGDDLVLTATAPGFSPQSISAGKVSPDSPPVTLTLAPGHTLKFHFIDQRGNPIPGVSAEPTSWQGKDVLRAETIITRSRTLKKLFTSDDAGNITWPSAPPDKVEFAFDKDDLFLSKFGNYSAADSPITITLTDALKITGKVTDAKTHQPIPNFNFFVGEGDSADKDPDWYAQPHPATAGAFSYIDTQGSKFAFIRVEAPGYPPMIRSAPLDNNSAALSFELATANGLQITVLQPDKRPATNVKVHLATKDAEFSFDDDAVRDGDSPGDPPFQLTDQLGQCLLLDPGKKPARIIILDAEGFADLPADSLHTNPTITLEPWGSLRLHIHDGTTPLAHAVININYNLPATAQTPALSIEIQQKTSATGDAMFYHLPPRKLTINYDLRANENSNFSQGVGLTLKTLTPTPDQSLDIPLDNSGQIIIGKILRPAGPAFESALFSLGEIETLSAPSLYTPEERAELKKIPIGEGRKKWNDNFFKQNPERIQAYIKMRTAWDAAHPPTYSAFVANPDGSFRATNISPGERTLTIFLIDPATGSYIATLHHNFTVAEKTPPSPLNLGDLQLEKNP